MVSLCRYKNVLGIPRQGFHALRIPVIDTALNDFFGTILGSLLTWYFLGKERQHRWTTHFGGWLLLGSVLHYLFCVY